MLTNAAFRFQSGEQGDIVIVNLQKTPKVRARTAKPILPPIAAWALGHAWSKLGMLQDKHAALLLHCRVDRVLRHLVSALALSVPSIRRSLKLSLTFEAEPLSPGRRRKRPVHVDSCERKVAKREHIDGGAMDAMEVVRAAAEGGGMNSGDSDSAVDARIWRLTLMVGTAGVRRCPFAEHAVVKLPWPHRPEGSGSKFATQPIVLLTQPFQSEPMQQASPAASCSSY